MRLLIKNLERKDGYLICKFKGGKFLGENDDQIAIVGDNPDANFEVAISQFERGMGKQYMIYQTPKNWPYETCGVIVDFWINEQVEVYFQTNQLDCLEVLSQECHFKEDGTLERHYILKVTLTEEHPVVCLYEEEKNVKNNGRRKYIFTKDTVKVKADNELISGSTKSILFIPFLKLEQQMPDID